MKQKSVRIPLLSFFELGGIVNAGDLIYCKPLHYDVEFDELVNNEHGDVLVKWKFDNNHTCDLPSTINDFMINADLVLKAEVTDVVTRAYNMGAFSGNAMARTLHKEIECLSLPQFLEKENL